MPREPSVQPSGNIRNSEAANCYHHTTAIFSCQLLSLSLVQLCITAAILYCMPDVLNVDSYLKPLAIDSLDHRIEFFPSSSFSVRNHIDTTLIPSC